MMRFFRNNPVVGGGLLTLTAFWLMRTYQSTSSYNKVQAGIISEDEYLNSISHRNTTGLIFLLGMMLVIFLSVQNNAQARNHAQPHQQPRPN